MLNVVRTDRFMKSFKTLPQIQKNKLKKQLGIFFENMFHPSLHTEKLEPRYKNIWSFRVDQKHRTIFTFVPSKNELWLLDIGPHDIYRKR